MVATPEVVNLIELYRDERDRNALLLEESRKATLAMADKYADARSGSEPEECSALPVKLGTYVERVAQIAIERSRRKAEGKR